MDGHTASKLTLGGLFCRGVIFKYKYLVILIIYSILKIILKERQERKQQRLQENAVSSAFTSDDVQDVESSGDDLTLEQGEPLGCFLRNPSVRAAVCSKLSRGLPTPDPFVIKASQY